MLINRIRHWANTFSDCIYGEHAEKSLKQTLNDYLILNKDEVEIILINISTTYNNAVLDTNDKELAKKILNQFPEFKAQYSNLKD